ncbi:MAG: hypothetical protein GW859_05720 [Sphingomonadales bacterium]|nr:hypothetical protein [Sphingomonadales bacterium]
MTKIRIPFAFALAAMASGLTVPAIAQDPAAADAGADTIRQQVVYGDDQCTQPTSDNETVVCIIVVEAERYRIPAILRGDPNASENQAWATKIERIETISRTGINSCSPTGLGGFTGCSQKMINAAVAARKQDARVDWAAAISEQRRERIDAIDANARKAEEAYQNQLATQDAREAEMAAARARLEAEERGETVAPLPQADGTLAVPPVADDTPDDDE